MFTIKDCLRESDSKKVDHHSILKINSQCQLCDLLYLSSYHSEVLLEKMREFLKIPPEKNLVINIRMKTLENGMDFEWERRIKMLCRNMLELEKIMWNLSTLGGAYSAMGDYDTKYAQTAAQITQYQIILAKKFGDPSVLARCYLYTSIAEAQLGRIPNAMKLVRLVYFWSTVTTNCPFVANCCKGVYQKIVSIHKFRKTA